MPEEAFHGKMRGRQAYLTVASSGPHASALGALPVRSRMAAQLRWTTADGIALDTYFRDPEAYDAGDPRHHIALSDSSTGEFRAAIDAATRWLGGFAHEPDWDGGALNINFAGHGQPGDGALVFRDGTIEADALIGALVESRADHHRGPRRLRVSLMLDSCHSGAFLARFVVGCWANAADALYPFASVAACMHDEVAWEADRLRHGVMSYGIALDNGDEDLGEKPYVDLRPLAMRTTLTWWKVAPFLTHGRQNPVTFHEAGEFNVGERWFKADDDRPDVQAIEAALVPLRNERAADVRALAPFIPPEVSLDADIQSFERSATGDQPTGSDVR